MSGLTDKEAEVYDRQIRLWGVDAQQRMRSSRILVAGMTSAGSEVAKNLTLAGINVVLQDDAAVTHADVGASFFLTDADVGSNVSRWAAAG
jgi:ubiquitin-like 1-activating enzyme E1 A